MRLLVPKAAPPAFWLALPLIDNINRLLPALPTTGGVDTDMIWTLSLPMISSILTTKVELVSSCVVTTLQSFAAACQSHVSSEEVSCDEYDVILHHTIS